MNASILLPGSFFLLCSAALTVALSVLMEAPAKNAAIDAWRADEWRYDGDRVGFRPPPIRRQADGLFYVVARVNGAPVRFLLDTGSSVVILSQADARRAGLSRNGPSSAVRTAAGTTTMAHARLSRITFSGRTLRGVEAAIAPSSVTVSLMGQTALSRLGSMRIEGDSLTFD